MPAATPSVEADTPDPIQGDTAENPIPAPKARSTSANAAITTPPAATAPQETPDNEASASIDSATAPCIPPCEICTATSPLDPAMIVWQKQIRRPSGKFPNGRLELRFGASAVLLVFTDHGQNWTRRGARRLRGASIFCGGLDAGLHRLAQRARVVIGADVRAQPFVHRGRARCRPKADEHGHLGEALT